MQTLWQDLSYAVRTLRKKPGFTFVAIITLALGIGVNAALFSVFDAFVLKPLPLKDPDSLVSLGGRNAQGERHNLVSYRDYLDYRDQNSTLSGVVAWNKVRATLGEAPPAQVTTNSPRAMNTFSDKSYLATTLRRWVQRCPRVVRFNPQMMSNRAASPWSC